MGITRRILPFEPAATGPDDAGLPPSHVGNPIIAGRAYELHVWTPDVPVASLPDDVRAMSGGAWYVFRPKARPTS